MMGSDIDASIALFEELVAKRREIDRRIEAFLRGEGAKDKKVKCGHCGDLGHNKATCPKLKAAAPVVDCQESSPRGPAAESLQPPIER